MTVLDAIIVSAILLLFLIIYLIILFREHVKDIKHKEQTKNELEKLLNEISKNEEQINNFDK